MYMGILGWGCCGVYGFPAQYWISSIGISGGMPHICMLARSLAVVPWISLRRHIPSGIYQSASALTESDGLGDTECPSRNSPLSSLKDCDWCIQEKLNLNVKDRSSFTLLSSHLTCDRMALKGLPELWLSGFLVSTALLATDDRIALLLEWTSSLPSPGVVGRSSQPHSGGDVTVNPSPQRGGAEVVLSPKGECCAFCTWLITTDELRFTIALL